MITAGRRSGCPWALPALLLMAAAPPASWSQTARIGGRITDATGAVIPRASIMVIHRGTSFLRRTQSNGVGLYSVPLLPPGRYRIVVRKEGFRPVNRSGIVLKVGQRAVVDFVLDVGVVTEEVRVSFAIPLLNSAEASLGQVIGNRRVVGMPLNGRHYVQLALLAAGAVQPVGGRVGGFSVAGQKTTQNNYLLDGMDNNGVELAGAQRRSEMVQPSVDAIQEFKLQTNAYAAEYGRAMGGVVNVTTRSGSNELHGSAFWFHRNEALDAKNYFDPPEKPKPPFKRHQFGFAVGGPVVKNRTFFFGDYEETLVRESRTATSTLPTAAMRRGDFSGLGIPLRDPLTGKPFPGNLIPGNRWDPLGARLLQLYPLPQRAGRAANFIYQSPDREDVRKFDARLDHNAGPNDTFFARVSFHDRVFPAALALPPPAFGGGFDGTVTGWNVGASWTHVFAAGLVASVRGVWNYAAFTRANPAAAGRENWNALLGVPEVNRSRPGGFAVFALSGYRNLGLGGFNGVDRDSQNRQLAADLIWSPGKHTVKSGFNLLRSQNNIVNVRNDAGVFRFNGKFSGDAAADLLLGATSSFTWSTPLAANLRGWLLGGFLQDDWRISPRLTLNLGVRYELALPWLDRYDRMGTFDFETTPGAPALVPAGAPEAGSGRMRRSLVAADTDNLMPRLGIAWRLRPHTALRAGYGIYYGYLEPTGDAQFLIANPPFAWGVERTSSAEQPAFPLAEGPGEGSLTLEQATGLTFSSYERRPAREYSQQWSLTLQRELPQLGLIEVGYAGAKGSHLLIRHDGNFSPPGPGDLNGKRPIRSVEIPGTGIVASPLGPVIYHHFAGNVSYHALVSRFERRWSRGLTLLAAYTYSRAIGDTCGYAASGNAPGCGYQDPRNLRLEKAPDNQDVPHRLVVSGLWDVPFGSGRRWSAGGAIFDALFGSWTIGSIVTFSSGRPFSLLTPGNPANTGTNTIVNRPDSIGRLHTDHRSIERDFNTDAVVPNGRYRLGALGRNVLRERRRFGWDFSAFKTLPVTEWLRLQLRFEAFQFTNTPRFGTPGNQVGTADFGRITRAATPRNLQLGLKLLF